MFLRRCVHAKRLNVSEQPKVNISQRTIIHIAGFLADVIRTVCAAQTFKPIKQFLFYRNNERTTINWIIKIRWCFTCWTLKWIIFSKIILIKDIAEERYACIGSKRQYYSVSTMLIQHREKWYFFKIFTLFLCGTESVSIRDENRRVFVLAVEKFQRNTCSRAFVLYVLMFFHLWYLSVFFSY